MIEPANMPEPHDTGTVHGTGTMHGSGPRAPAVFGGRAGSPVVGNGSRPSLGARHGAQGPGLGCPGRVARGRIGDGVNGRYG